MAHPISIQETIPSRQGVIEEEPESALSFRFGVRLPDLLPEILELICGYLIGRSNSFTRGFPRRMYHFRLTCRLIQAKTHDFFCRMAFHKVIVRLNSTGLSRLKVISDHANLASKVHQIFISGQDEGLSAWKYEDAIRTAASTTVSVIERERAVEEINNARSEQADKAFLERSATDGIIMVSALQRLPNLQLVFLSSMQVGERHMSIRRKYSGQGQSMNHIFSMVLSSVAYANLRPKEFRMDMWGGIDIGGVSISALEVYPPLSECLSELQTLNLRLETEDNLYESPEKWQNHLAAFLGLCPKLRCLALRFSNDWKNTEAIFHNVAANVRFQYLEKFTLQNVRCAGQDLRQFLQFHKSLQTLELATLDVVGTTSFGSVLQVLETGDTKLQLFKCNQIAENSHRLYLESLGKIKIVKGMHGYTTFRHEELGFFDDFEFIQGPFKYLWEAEEWEGVQQKIKLIREDLRVSNLLYHSDHEIGWITWAH